MFLTLLKDCLSLESGHRCTQLMANKDPLTTDHLSAVVRSSSASNLMHVFFCTDSLLLTQVFAALAYAQGHGTLFLG